MNDLAVLVAPSRASQSLRELALIGVSDWFEVPPDQLSATAQEGLSDLLSVLAQPEDLTHIERSGAKRFTDGFLVTDPADLSLSQMRWVSRHMAVRPILDLPNRARDARDLYKQKQQLTGDPTLSLMLDALVKRAWLDTKFRRQISGILRAYVRQRVILYPDGDIMPALAEPTLWAAVLHGLNVAQLDVADRSHARLNALLTQTASAALNGDGWAGFWDGYALTRPGAAAVLEGTKLEIKLSIDIAVGPQYRLNWKQEVPGFAKPLLNDMI